MSGGRGWVERRVRGPEMGAMVGMHGNGRVPRMAHDTRRSCIRGMVSTSSPTCALEAELRPPHQRGQLQARDPGAENASGCADSGRGTTNLVD